MTDSGTHMPDLSLSPTLLQFLPKQKKIPASQRSLRPPLRARAPRPDYTVGIRPQIDHMKQHKHTQRLLLLSNVHALNFFSLFFSRCYKLTPPPCIYRRLTQATQPTRYTLGPVRQPSTPKFFVDPLCSPSEALCQSSLGSC
jgi:hypothetical protein